ncbi:MAG TPA: DoxX family protein [Thermoanaerobaculia bacterium]
MATEILPAAGTSSLHRGTAVRLINSGARILLGFIFFATGLNGILQFVAMPAMQGNAATFMAGLVASGYVFPVLFVTYIVAGGALLANRFVPLALVLLAPAIVNIFALHLFLDPHGLPLALVVVALEIFLAWRYREAYRPLFHGRMRTAEVTTI